MADEELDIAERTWRKNNAPVLKDGFREGFEAGRVEAYQKGFDLGYEEGMRNSFKLGHLNGTIRAINEIDNLKEKVIESNLSLEPIEEAFKGECVMCPGPSDTHENQYPPDLLTMESLEELVKIQEEQVAKLLETYNSLGTFMSGIDEKSELR